MGMIKGRTAIRVFNKFKKLKQKPYWGNKFWSRGYCVDTVGLDSDMIRKYVKHQEWKDKKELSNQICSVNINCGRQLTLPPQEARHIIPL